jgi:apolipoprotein N-acyltransferase
MVKSKEKLSLFWLARYKPYPMVILSGVLFVLSFPPFPFAFLIYFAFVPLLLVIDQTPDKVFEDRFWGTVKAFLIMAGRALVFPIWLIAQGLLKVRKNDHFIDWKGWLIYKRKIISHHAQIFRYAYTAFIIWNIGCCYWLMLTALSVPTTGEAISALVAGLVANLVNPILMTIPLWFYTKMRKVLHRNLASLTLIFFWVTFEFLHFNWDLTWSWLTLGHSLSYYPEVLQYLEFTGIFGVSIQILLVNVLIYQHLYAIRDKDRKAAFIRGGAIAALIGIPFLLNLIILNPNRAIFQPAGTLNVRVIQPNVDPYVKFEAYTRQDQIETFTRLISLPGIDSIDLVVMPETAIPKGLWTDQIREDPLIQPLWDLVREYDFTLLTGISEFRYFPPDTEKLPPSARKIYDGYYDVCNASTLLQQDSIIQTHQKAKLVPMIERMPFLEFFTFLKQYQVDLGGSFGNYGLPDSTKNLVLPGGQKIAPLVCYESEFGEFTGGFVRKGANLLTIITNDGWWKNSSGHIQHAHFTTLRAIESRRDIPRSANTGISLFGDSRGNLHQMTKYWTEATIDRKVNLYNGISFYVRHGDYLGWICGSLSLFLICFLIYRRIRFGKALIDPTAEKNRG